MSEIKRYHIEQFDEPIDKPSPEGNGNVVLYSDHIAALADLKAQLAALQWTPITESNLPKVGDEMLELKDSGEIYDIGPVTINWKKVPVSYVAATCFRRPINPPKEQSNG